MQTVGVPRRRPKWEVVISSSLYWSHVVHPGLWGIPWFTSACEGFYRRYRAGKCRCSVGDSGGSLDAMWLASCLTAESSLVPGSVDSLEYSDWAIIEVDLQAVLVARLPGRLGSSVVQAALVARLLGRLGSSVVHWCSLVGCLGGRTSWPSWRRLAGCLGGKATWQAVQFRW